MILHITNDYSGSTVYKNLIGAIDNLGIEQIIYNPIREANRIGKNKIELKNNNSKIIYAHILNKTDRIFYKKKINKIVKDIEKQVDFSKIKFIHAHTWYSDGGVAYLLSKKYKIPYLIAVRSTDINVFYKYLYQYRAFGEKILQNCNHIVLINKISRNKIHSIYPSLSSKLHVIPNGVDYFWIKNSLQKNSIPKKVYNLLYVGTFIKRKNLDKLIEAVISLSNEIPFILNIVGYGTGSYADKVKDLIKANPSNINYLGEVTDKNQLLHIYRQNDIFTLPSNGETFGLVYIEALLQGLPILYTQNEGVDGFYEENIGEKVHQTEVNEIRNKLILFSKNIDKYLIPTQKIKENHNWEKIAKIYRELYNQ